MVQESPTWLDLLSPAAHHDVLRQIRLELATRLEIPKWDPQRAALERVKDLRASRLRIDQAQVCFGEAGDLTLEQNLRLEQTLRDLRPWKKGPFGFFGHEIDAEWRSDLKWDRLAPYVGSLEGQLVADIGCHNGYFMYRMLSHGARTVIGLEPYAQLWFTHRLMQMLHPRPELHFEFYGVEHMHHFAESFDTIFCLGILYHHTDPVGLLRKMRKALRPGGRIFIDCQGLPGDEPLSLTPEGRYAGAAAIWFLPTVRTLKSWVLRSGFTRMHTIFSAPLTSQEQRSTAWAPIKSLQDFLDPQDSTRTVEGYPAPWRHYLMIRP